MLPVVEALAQAGCRVSIDTMRAEVATQRAGGGRRDGQRRQRRPGGPGHGRGRSPPPACRTSSCTGAGTAPTCTGLPSTPTSSPRCRPSLTAGCRRSRRRRRGPGPADTRSRPGLREAARAQLEAAGEPGPHRPPARLPRAVPGAGGRVAERDSSASCWLARTAQPRSFSRSDDATIAVTALAVGGRRVVRPGARRARQPGRRAGGDAVAAGVPWRALADAGPDLDCRPAGSRQPRRLRQRASGGPGVRRRRRAVARYRRRRPLPTTSA